MKKSLQELSKGSVSIERLHHFRCGKCNKWWSIGDPSIAKRKAKNWFCPWCGESQKFAIVK